MNIQICKDCGELVLEGINQCGAGDTFCKHKNRDTASMADLSKSGLLFSDTGEVFDILKTAKLNFLKRSIEIVGKSGKLLSSRREGSHIEERYEYSAPGASNISLSKEQYFTIAFKNGVPDERYYHTVVNGGGDSIERTDIVNKLLTTQAYTGAGGAYERSHFWVSFMYEGNMESTIVDCGRYNYDFTNIEVGYRVNRAMLSSALVQKLEENIHKRKVLYANKVYLDLLLPKDDCLTVFKATRVFEKDDPERLQIKDLLFVELEKEISISYSRWNKYEKESERIKEYAKKFLCA